MTQCKSCLEVLLVLPTTYAIIAIESIRRGNDRVHENIRIYYHHVKNIVGVFNFTRGKSQGTTFERQDTTCSKVVSWIVTIVGYTLRATKLLKS